MQNKTWHPNKRLMLIKRAERAVKSERWDKVIAVIRRLGSPALHSPQTLAMLADAFAHKGRADKARKCCRAALKCSVTNERILRELLAVSREIDDHKMTRAVTGRLHRLRPHAPTKARARHGVAASVSLQDHDEPGAKPLLVGKPSLAELAEVVRGGEFERAIDLGERLIEAEPKSVHAHMLLGASYFQTQKWREAIRCYEAALRRDPHNLIARNNLAAAYAKTLRKTWFRG